MKVMIEAEGAAAAGLARLGGWLINVSYRRGNVG